MTARPQNSTRNAGNLDELLSWTFLDVVARETSDCEGPMIDK